MDSIQDRVLRIVATQSGMATGAVSRDTNIFTDLGYDSLDFLELLMELEDEFGIELADEDCEKCRTAGDFIALVERSVAVKVG